jgi:hypothetical protein
MTDQQRSAPFWEEPKTVRSCWMCGIRLSADQMVPDGGSACPDLRWYCRDVERCTERWTSHPATLAHARQGTAETQKTQGGQAWGKTQGEQATGAGAARPVPV